MTSEGMLKEKVHLIKCFVSRIITYAVIQLQRDDDKTACKQCVRNTLGYPRESNSVSITRKFCKKNNSREQHFAKYRLCILYILLNLLVVKFIVCLNKSIFKTGFVQSPFKCLFQKENRVET